jgi:uncharacterized membrane protein
MFFLLLSMAVTVAIVLGAFTGVRHVLVMFGLPVWLCYTLGGLAGLLICLPVFWLVSWLLWPLTKMQTWVANRLDNKQMKAAKAAFRTEYPNQEPYGGKIIVEEKRWVIMLLCGDCRPPRYVFYEVDRGSCQAERLTDDSAYAPKRWL